MQTYKSEYSDRQDPLDKHHETILADRDCSIKSRHFAQHVHQSSPPPLTSQNPARSGQAETDRSCGAPQKLDARFLYSWEVCLLGSRPELGDWEATKALELKTGPKLWPRPGVG